METYESREFTDDLRHVGSSGRLASARIGNHTEREGKMERGKPLKPDSMPFDKARRGVFIHKRRLW